MIKQTVAAILAATFTSVTFSTPAPARQSNQSKIVQLHNTLTRANVSIYRQTQCGENVLATYNPRDNELILCPLTFSAESLLLETLTHEAVHAVQDCVADNHIGPDRNHNKIPLLAISDVVPTTKAWRTLMLRATDTKGEEIYSSMDTFASKHDKEERDRYLLYELEASALEDHPDVVIDMLRAACLGE